MYEADELIETSYFPSKEYIHITIFIPIAAHAPISAHPSN